VWDWPRGAITILCDHLPRVTNECRFSASLILIDFVPPDKVVRLADSDSSTVCGLGEDFGQVQGAGTVVLGDLFAAAEAVAEDDGFTVIANSGEQDSLG
jgi:hypothetical protein